MWGGTPFSSITALSLRNRPFITQLPFPYDNPPLFVIPSEAEGSAVLRTLLGNVFRQSAPDFSGSNECYAN